VTTIRAVFSVAIALAALAAIDARPSVAEVYRPWCVQYLGGFSGGTSCAFYSFEQCMETARGNGAYCYQNPWFLQYGEGGQAQGGGDRQRPGRR
jgi:Protein of unknown function (DUF3551)